MASICGVDRVLGVVLGSGVETNSSNGASICSFANEGLMPEAHLISRFENASGQVVASHKNSQKRVIDRAVADKMTSMMLGHLQMEQVLVPHQQAMLWQENWND